MKGREGGRTDPRALPGALGQVELVGEPRQYAVRVPDRHVRVVEPNCGEEGESARRWKRRGEEADAQFCLYLLGAQRQPHAHPAGRDERGGRTSSSC